jgi:hypothetical protein
MPDFRYKYSVSVNNDGGIVIDPLDAGVANGAVERTPNIRDILDSSRKLVSDLERQLTTDTVAEVLSALLAPTETPVSDKVKGALKERGIAPEVEQ